MVSHWKDSTLLFKAQWFPFEMSFNDFSVFHVIEKQCGFTSSFVLYAKMLRGRKSLLRYDYFNTFIQQNNWLSTHIITVINLWNESSLVKPLELTFGLIRTRASTQQFCFSAKQYVLCYCCSSQSFIIDINFVTINSIWKVGTDVFYCSYITISIDNNKRSRCKNWLRRDRFEGLLSQYYWLFLLLREKNLNFESWSQHNNKILIITRIKYCVLWYHRKTCV